MSSAVSRRAAGVPSPAPGTALRLGLRRPLCSTSHLTRKTTATKIRIQKTAMKMGPRIPIQPHPAQFGPHQYPCIITISHRRPHLRLAPLGPNRIAGACNCGVPAGQPPALLPFVLGPACHYGCPFRSTMVCAALVPEPHFNISTRPSPLLLKKSAGQKCSQGFRDTGRNRKSDVQGEFPRNGGSGRVRKPRPEACRRFGPREGAQGKGRGKTWRAVDAVCRRDSRRS